MNAQQSLNLVKQGYAYLQANNVAGALESFNQAVTGDPACYEGWFALGNLQLQLNNTAQAAACLKNAVDVSPDSYMAHGQLGVALYHLQRLDEAIECYRKVVGLQPENVSAYANLAIAYIDSGRREEAIACCTRAIKIVPDFTGAHILLASAHSALGEFEKAEKSYNDALELEPENLTALSGRANALIKLGKKKDAYNVIRAKVDAGCTDPSIATAYAAASTVAACEEDAASCLEKSLAISGLSYMQQLQLHFAAGALYDRMKQYDRAFEHIKSGNRLVQRTYEPQADKDLFDGIMDTFNKEAMERLAHSSQYGLMPVFIVGMPRSGTSLVERILGSHAEVYPAGELGNIPQLTERLSSMCAGEKRFPGCMTDFDEDVMNKLAREHLDYLAEISGASKVVTDKLPHNFLFLGLIQLLFPGARIIHCKRDPLDTCLSNYFQYFSGPLDYPYELSNIAQHYNHYLRIMAHWRKTIKLPMLEINYEDLVRNQESVTRTLLSFLDLTWDDACIKFNESEQVTRTASYEQVREPIYSRSIGRWRNYEKHLGELIGNPLLE